MMLSVAYVYAKGHRILVDAVILSDVDVYLRSDILQILLPAEARKLPVEEEAGVFGQPPVLTVPRYRPVILRGHRLYLSAPR